MKLEWPKYNVTCQISQLCKLVKSGTTDSSACTCMSAYTVHVHFDMYY